MCIVSSCDRIYVSCMCVLGRLPYTTKCMWLYEILASKPISKFRRNSIFWNGFILKSISRQNATQGLFVNVPMSNVCKSIITTKAPLLRLTNILKTLTLAVACYARHRPASWEIYKTYKTILTLKLKKEPHIRSYTKINSHEISPGSLLPEDSSVPP